jgi:hypothetical protein
MIRTTVALLLSLLVTIPTALAQKRVQFESGRSNALIKDKTNGGPDESGGKKPVSYVLRARADQQIVVEVSSPKHTARFQIRAPGKQLMEDAVKRTGYVGKLPATGDYEIVVYPRDGVDTSFTLDVGVGPSRKQSPDAEIIEMLRKEGENLSKPQKIEFNLSFDSKANASRAADKLKAEGFATRVEQVDRSITWWVFAARTMVPKEEELAKWRQRLRVVAAQEEGEYDVWSIVK